MENGQIAYYTKAHHSGIDGKAGVELAKVFYDLTPAGERQRIARIEPAGGNSHRDHDQQQDQARDRGGTAEVALDRIHRASPPPKCADRAAHR